MRKKALAEGEAEAASGGPAEKIGSSTQRNTKGSKGEYEIEPQYLRMYNRIEDNYHLANKKALFYNLTHMYRALGQDPFDAIPVTFHI